MQQTTDSSQLFGRMLDGDEELLWKGQPVDGRWFYPLDFFPRLAFGPILASIPVYFAVSFFRDEPGEHFTGYILLLLGLISLAIGWSQGLGGLVKRVRIMRYSRYAVTNKRVIIANIRGGVSFKSIPLKQIKGMTLSGRTEDRTRTLVLADVNPYDIRMVRFSVDTTFSRSTWGMQGVSYFFEISDAENVQNIIKNLLSDRGASDKTMEPNSLEEIYHAAPILYRPRSVQPALAALVFIGSFYFQFSTVWLGIVFAFYRLCSPPLKVGDGNTVKIVFAFFLLAGIGLLIAASTDSRDCACFDTEKCRSEPLPQKFFDKAAALVQIIAPISTTI